LNKERGIASKAIGEKKKANKDDPCEEEKKHVNDIND